MKRNTLLVGAAIGAVAALALTACAPRDSGGGIEERSEVTLVDSLPAGTQPVDQVTWSIVEGEPATLHPANSANLIIPNLCDNLLSLQPDYSIEPGVAESAEWVDPVTFVIKIRDDVTFWDGSPVTADDVVYSLGLNLNPESQWFGAFALVAPGGIVATGPNEVTVNFVAPDSTFRDAIAGQGGAVMQKAFGEEAGTALGTAEAGLMCTGPFALAQGDWTLGKEIVTTANEDYWGGAPLVKKLTYVFVTDGATLTTALTQGEIDGAYGVSPTSRSAFESDGAGRLLAGASTSSYSIGPVAPEGPAANPTFRLGLSYALDREQIIDTVLNGLGYIQNTMVPEFSFQSMEAAEIYQAGYDALATPTLDLEKAKQLIEESGEDLSQPLSIAIPAGAKEFQQIAQIFQSSAAKVGVTIEINEMQPADFGAMFYDPANRQGVDFLSTQGYLETPGVVGYPSLFMVPEDMGGVFNWTNYSNPVVTESMGAARTSPDSMAAAEAFVDAQAVFAPDQLQITLAGNYHLTYLNNDLTGAVTTIAAFSSPWALHLGAA